MSLQYAFNLFSHNSSMDPELGYNEEEIKMVKETKKIWGTQDVNITATCIRVPVMRAHAESINLEFEADISEDAAKAALEKAEGVSIIDDRCAWAWVCVLGAGVLGGIVRGAAPTGAQGAEGSGQQPRRPDASNHPPSADAVLAAARACVYCCRNKNRFPTPLDATTQDDVYVGRIRRDISRKDNKGLELFVCGDQIKKGELSASVGDCRVVRAHTHTRGGGGCWSVALRACCLCGTVRRQPQVNL